MATGNTATVISIYQSVAGGLSPSAPDLAAYVALLNGGWTTAQLTVAIQVSPIVVNVVNPITSQYQAAFGHAPDQASLNALVGAYHASYPNSTQLTAGQLVMGTSGNDTLTANAGSIVYGGAGSDTITGAASSVTTAVYAGSVSQYAITQTGNSAVVADTVSGRDGTDNLTNVSQAEFSDYTVVFNLHSAEDLLVYKLYQAAFARVPDDSGFTYWAGVGDSANVSALAFANQFLTSAEFTQKYGANPSVHDYVTAMYTNILGRAPDDAGLAYWVGNVNAGESRAQLLVDFATSAENAQLIGAHVSNGYWTTH